MNTRLFSPASGEKVLELILAAIKDLVNYELAVVLKLSDDNTLIVQNAQGPLVNARISNYKIDLKKRTDIARIISIDEPHLFAEEEKHTDTYEEVIDLPENHSCLVAPLHVQDKPIGLLTFDHRTCGVFSPTIVRFIGTLAKLIAVIIAQNDSSRHLDSLRRNLTRERNLLLRSSHKAFASIVGNSPAWERILEQIKTVAESELPVLIQGETGTGKEQVARTIHALSPRSDKPFITLNCSALTTTLAESELFGHEKGAFTSAINTRKGRFEIADGGTLFLDEIADLPPQIQPKLLRTLQEGTYERVGGEVTRTSDVRIIAASNKDLKTETGAGRFREDLYYRLGVFPLFLPPLRERDQDVLLLAEHFLEEAAGTKTPRPVLGEKAVHTILNYAWPGNVRELQNAMRRAVLVAKENRIEGHHLGLKISDSTKKTSSGLPPEDETSNFPSLEENERSHIQKALARCSGKTYGADGAAALLGLKPTTLQSRMKKLGIRRKADNRGSLPEI